MAIDPTQYEDVTADVGAPAAPKKLDSSQYEDMPAHADGMSPDTPVNQSPVSPTDRALLSLGNKAGNIKFLKQNFDDARIDKASGDAVVQKDGTWYKVNAKTLDPVDPWAETQNILGKDQVDMLKRLGQKAPGDVGGPRGRPELLGPAINAAATTAGSGVTGPLIAGGISEALRTSLGRLAGTYDATPEQQLKDVGWEGILNTGGQLVAAGVKPTFGMLRSALGNIGDTATNFAKENLANAWGTLSGAGKWATRRAMDAADRVIPLADEAIKKIGPAADREEAKSVLAGIQNNSAKELASGVGDALRNNWNRNSAQLLKDVPTDFKADMTQIATESLGDLGAVGKWVAGSASGKPRFKLLGDDEIIANLKQLGQVPDADVPKIFGPKTREALETISSTLQKYANAGNLEGKSGAKQVLQLKRAVSESLEDMVGFDSPPSIRRMVAQLKEQFNDRIGGAFAEAGVGPQYSAMNGNYNKYVDGVRMLQDYADPKNVGGLDTLVKKIVKGNSQQFSDEAHAVAELMGPEGAAKLNKMVDAEAAKGFVTFTNGHSGGGNSAISAARAAGAIVQQTNPSVIRKQIEYGSKFGDFVKTLSPSDLKTFLKDDNAVAQALRVTLSAYDGEDQNVQGLLSKAGVK